MDSDVIESITSKPILHFNARGLEHFPSEFEEYGMHTREIYMKWNRLTTLPPWIRKLSSLTNLYLSHNLLLNLPEEFFWLQNLEVLVINDNQLKILPCSIGLLQKLKFLDISKNELSCLPRDICHLHKLQILFAGENKLEFLPYEMCACQELEEIVLDTNMLFCIPRSLVYLQNLNFLSLTNNPILYLPAMPFISNPKLNITPNSYLNYGSYEVLQQLTSMFNSSNILHLKNQSCSSWDIIHVSGQCVQIQTLCSNEKQILYLPGPLQMYSSDFMKNKVNSLLELCTREVFKLYQNALGPNSYRQITRFHSFLPYNLEVTIRDGPVAQCFFPNCPNPIFNEAFGWLTHTSLNQLQHCVLFFCSTNCALKTYMFIQT